MSKILVGQVKVIGLQDATYDLVLDSDTLRVAMLFGGKVPLPILTTAKLSMLAITCGSRICFGSSFPIQCGLQFRRRKSVGSENDSGNFQQGSFVIEDCLPLCW